MYKPSTSQLRGPQGLHMGTRKVWGWYDRLTNPPPPHSGLVGCTRARKTDFKFVMWEHKFLMPLGVCCNNLLEFLKSSDYGKRN